MLCFVSPCLKLLFNFHPHSNLCVLAATSLISAIYSILRSLIALSLLYGFCFGALKVDIHKTKTNKQNKKKKKTEQRLLLSPFFLICVYGHPPGYMNRRRKAVINSMQPGSFTDGTKLSCSKVQSVASHPSKVTTGL